MEVVGSTVMTSLSRVVEVIRRASSASSTYASRSVLRLDDVIWVREPVEDSGEFSASLMEYSSRLLVARRPYRDGVMFTPVGVDSSSRHVETPVADVVVGAVVAISSLGSIAFEWPSLGPLRYTGRLHPVFYMLSNAGVQFSFEDPLVSTVNPSGRPFDISYSVGEACDEMRVSLENWVLEVLGGLLEAQVNPVVMVDGPLYVVAKALTRDVQPWIRDVWVKLLEGRVKAIRGLESRGVPVIGVVKRVEKSTILSRTRGLEGIRGDIVEGDKSVILRAMTMLGDRVPGRIYVTPRIIVRTPQLPEVGVLEKVVQYIVIPPGKFQLSPPLVRVYRLEYTLKTLGILQDTGLEPDAVIGGDSVGRGALEPLSIRLSDLRSSFLSHALKKALLMNIISVGAPLSYWSLREAEISWRE
ncbi:MAG: DNA double-strand break repair nuclease NurA [Acidilobaceae archaeon]